jgi:hypothetical protein
MSCEKPFMAITFGVARQASCSAGVGTKRKLEPCSGCPNSSSIDDGSEFIATIMAPSGLPSYAGNDPVFIFSTIIFIIHLNFVNASVCAIFTGEPRGGYLEPNLLSNDKSVIFITVPQSVTYKRIVLSPAKIFDIYQTSVIHNVYFIHQAQ